MPFEKGKSGNPLGKPVGTISEKTKIWNEISDWFAGEGLSVYKDNLMTLMSSTDRKERAEAMKRYETLLEYFKPKLSRAEIEAKVEVTDEVDLSQYKTEDLKKAIENDSDKDKS